MRDFERPASQMRAHGFGRTTRPLQRAGGRGLKHGASPPTARRPWAPQAPLGASRAWPSPVIRDGAYNDGHQRECVAPHSMEQKGAVEFQGMLILQSMGWAGGSQLAPAGWATWHCGGQGIPPLLLQHPSPLPSTPNTHLVLTQSGRVKGASGAQLLVHLGIDGDVTQGSPGGGEGQVGLHAATHILTPREQSTVHARGTAMREAAGQTASSSLMAAQQPPNSRPATPVHAGW